MFHIISLASLPSSFLPFNTAAQTDKPTYLLSIYYYTCIELTKKLHIRLDKAKNWIEVATHETIYHPDNVDSCGNVGRWRWCLDVFCVFLLSFFFLFCLPSHWARASLCVGWEDDTQHRPYNLWCDNSFYLLVLVTMAAAISRRGRMLQSKKMNWQLGVAHIIRDDWRSMKWAKEVGDGVCEIDIWFGKRYFALVRLFI